MIVRFGACYVPTDTAPTLAQMSALRSFGLTHTRITPGLDNLSPEPGVWKFDALDATIARATEAGLVNYLNPSNAPAHASGGLPAFQPGVGGAAAWWLFTQAKLSREVIRAVFKRAAELEAQGHSFPPEQAVYEIVGNSIFHGSDSHVLRFGREYRAEQQRTWSRDDPFNATGTHAYGAKGYEEADAVTGQRSWMLDPKRIPVVDPAFLAEAGRRIGERYTPAQVRYHGWGNEFGNDMCWLPIRFDGANVAGGEDMVRTRVIHEIAAYASGVVRVSPPAMPWLIGGEHDGSDIMRRIFDAEAWRMWRDLPNPSLDLFDIIGIHPYGPPQRIADEWMPVIQQHSLGRPWAITEIADPNMAEWLDEVLARHYPWGVYFLQDEWLTWYEDWSAGQFAITPRGAAVQKVMVRHGAAIPVASVATGRRRTAGR